MQLIARREDREYWSHALTDAAELQSPFSGQPYVCLVWAAREAPVDEQAAVAASLVRTNCAYAVCGGTDCERWHDVIDEVTAERDAFMMTTWHEGEPLPEVAWFFANVATEAEGRVFTRYLAVSFGGDPLVELMVANAVRQAIGVRAV